MKIEIYKDGGSIGTAEAIDDHVQLEGAEEIGQLLASLQWNEPDLNNVEFLKSVTERLKSNYSAAIVD